MKPSDMSHGEAGCLKYYFGSLVQFAEIEAEGGRLTWADYRELYYQARKLATRARRQSSKLFPCPNSISVL
jgi:guanylate kinase